MKNTLNKSLSLATKTLILVAVLLFETLTTKAQIITTIAGNGIQSYSGDSGLATGAQLNTPCGVCVDAFGNIYIADYNNFRIRKITASTGIITTIAGTGVSGYNGDNILATSAKVTTPLGICVDASGNVYFGDRVNNRIRKINASTGIITTVAGNGTGNYNGDNILATNAELSAPGGVCVDGSGNIYIGDCNNNRIRKVTASTGIITTIAGNGTYGYNGDNILATSAEINSGAAFVCVDASGNVYFGDYDNFRVRKINVSTGIITTVAGNGTQGYNGDNILATSAELYSPLGVYVDASGNLYIADLYNYRIRKVSASTGIITTIAGTGTAGYNGDNILATNAELNTPYDVCVGASGKVYISDIDDRIRKITCATSTYSRVSLDTSNATILMIDTVVMVHIDTISNNIITTTDSIYVSHHINTRMIVADSTAFSVNQCTNVVDSTQYSDTTSNLVIALDTVIHQSADTVACPITTYNNVIVTGTFPSTLTNDTLVTVHIDTVLNDVITTTDSMFISTHTYSTILVKDSTVFMVNQCTNITDSIIYADTISTSDIVVDTVTHESFDTVVCHVTVHNQVIVDTTHANALASIDTVVMVYVDTIVGKVTKITTTTDSLFISAYVNITTVIKDSTIFSVNQCDSSVTTKTYSDTATNSTTTYDTATHQSLDTTILVNTGLGNIDLPLVIKVYPNPFHNGLTVDVGDEITTIILTDALGRTVIQTKGAGHVMLEPNVLSGVYFLRVTSKNESSTIIKVIAE